MISEPPHDFIDKVLNIVGHDQIFHTPQDLKYCKGDRSPLWKNAPCMVVRPDSTTQIANLVRLANLYQVEIVPNGGCTGLSGGAVAANGEMVIALDRMNRILAVNPADQTILCGAGVITRQLQETAADHDLYYPVDFASAGSSQIGGNIATNAGGIKVIRYGMTRHWVRGLTVVTGGGDILNLNNGLIKNNCGYDLQQLFIGSEGSLGIICEATMAVTKPPVNLTVMVLSTNSLHHITEVLARFRNQLDITAFEFFDHRALQYVTANQRLNKPFSSAEPYYILVEFDDSSVEVNATALALFEQALADHIILDGVISNSIQQTRNLWRLREDISEQLAPLKPYKNDISVITSRLPAFANDVEKLLSQHFPDWQIVWYGHIGDGNLHLNVLKPEALPYDDFINGCHRLSSLLAELISQYGGSISAEHGVGLLKKPFLESTRSRTEIALMKQLKTVFDPNNIMNPGKIFDAG